MRRQGKPHGVQAHAGSAPLVAMLPGGVLELSSDRETR